MFWVITLDNIKYVKWGGWFCYALQSSSILNPKVLVMRKHGEGRPTCTSWISLLHKFCRMQGHPSFQEQTWMPVSIWSKNLLHTANSTPLTHTLSGMWNEVILILRLSQSRGCHGDELCWLEHSGQEQHYRRRLGSIILTQTECMHHTWFSEFLRGLVKLSECPGGWRG
jgi:hypothetical protein